MNDDEPVINEPGEVEQPDLEEDQDDDVEEVLNEQRRDEQDEDEDTNQATYPNL